MYRESFFGVRCGERATPVGLIHTKTAAVEATREASAYLLNLYIVYLILSHETLETKEILSIFSQKSSDLVRRERR